MTVAPGLLSVPTSPLGKCDARAKLVGVVVLLAALCSLRQVWVAGLACGIVAGLVWLAAIPPRWLVRRLGALLVPMLPFVVFLPFTVHRGGSAWNVGPLNISLAGIEAAAVLILKANALLALALTLLVSTPVPVLLQAAAALRIPGVLVQLVLLTHRHVFVLLDELRQLRVAVRVRGFRSRMDRHTYRTAGHVTGTLLLRSQERAQRVSQAMRCRGFNGQLRPVRPMHGSIWDLILLVLLIGAAILLLVADHHLFLG